jgi:uncharacterized protein (TIGR03790 family)
MTKTTAQPPLSFLLLCATCAFAWADNPLSQRVLVVSNSAKADSVEVARYYMMRRGIAEKLHCRISVDSIDAITQEEFDTAVKGPIQKCLAEAGKQRILYIVFSYLTPFAVTFGNRRFSLDQLVADVWDEYLPAGTASTTAKPQPYFGDAESQGNVYIHFIPLATYRDGPAANHIYSVWRLDGANMSLAKGLVDKALAAEAGKVSGVACFDRRFGAIDTVADSSYGEGDWDIHQAAEFSRQAGFPTTEDDQAPEFGTPPAPARCNNALLYAGWYSLNHYNDAFSWAPGAIGIHLDSYSALNPRGGDNWVANAVLKGITITTGAVGEPYLQGLPHPDQMFLYLFQGANAGDAVMRSTRWLKWMIINIGDPLYRPFPQGIAPFNLAGYDQPVLAVVPQSFVGGTSALVHFHLTTPAPPGGTPVSFKSDHPELISAAETIIIPEKMDSVSFPVIARLVTSETVVRIWVSAEGVTKLNTITLFPPPAKP